MSTSSTPPGYGVIRNDIVGLAITECQIGGQGRALWKMLMNGSHLVGAWNCVEYVVLDPGSSVGGHTHVRTEEIYYIIAGRPHMVINGEEYVFEAGDLITAPIGTHHAIRNDTNSAVEFFVVEVFPELDATQDFSYVNVESSGGKIDLQKMMPGYWRSFTKFDLAVSATEADASSDCTEVLFVLEGQVSVAVGEESYRGERGLAMAIPPGSLRRLGNVGSMPASVISLRVSATCN